MYDQRSNESALPDDPYPDGPYRPSHWPPWARDEIFAHVDVHFDWVDRFLILIGRTVTVRVQTVVAHPPGRCASRTAAWAWRILWPWSKPAGGYSPTMAGAPDRRDSLACPSCGLLGVEVTAPSDDQRVFIHGATAIGGTVCGPREWTVPYG